MPEHAEAHRLLADVVDTLEEMGASVGEAKVNRARDGDVHVSLTADLSDGVDVPTVEEIGAGEALDELRQERDEAVEEVKRLNEELADVPSDDVDELEDERDRLQERAEQLTETINRQAEKIAELQNEIDELETKAKNRHERAQELTTQRDRLKQRLEEKDETIADLEEERDTAIERADQLESQLVDGVDREQDGEDVPDEPVEETEPDDQDDEGDAEDDVDEDDQEDVDRNVDVTPTEQTILDVLEAEGETTSTVIGEEAEISTSSVSTHLSNLRGKDLVEGREHPDSANRKLYSLATDADGEEPGVEDLLEEPSDEEVERLQDALDGGGPEQDPEDTPEDAPGPTEEDSPRAGPEEALPDDAHPKRVQFTRALQEHGPTTVDELADELDVPGNHVHKQFTVLREHDVLGSRRDPDEARRKLYWFDPDGSDDREEPGAEDEQEPEDTDETERWYPRDCGDCGATLDDTIEWAVHKTEVHGTPQYNLGNLEPGEFPDLVEDAESLSEITDEVPWESEKTLRVLGAYGLQDVIGGDVELSDVNDFEFDGVDESEEATEAEKSATVQEPAPASGDPPTAAKICMRHDLDRDEVVDAIVNAQGAFHVRRDLGLPADVADTLLNELGFLEELKGTGKIGRERAKEEVYKQVPRSIAADGGGEQ